MFKSLVWTRKTTFIAMLTALGSIIVAATQESVQQTGKVDWKYIAISTLAALLAGYGKSPLAPPKEDSTAEKDREGSG